MKKSEKYFVERICMGGDCTAKSQKFIYAPAAQTAASMFSSEVLDMAIKRVNRGANINGIKGLCAKKDVIAILKELQKEKFSIQ